MKRVVILGGNGDGLVAAEVIRDLALAGEAVELYGFLNDHQDVGSFIEGWPVLGRTSDWQSLDDDVLFHFSLLSVGKMKERSELISSFAIPRERVISLIHPTAKVSSSCEVSAGVLITAYAVLQPGTKVGFGCSIRSGANLGHDVDVGEFCYVGPNATLCGYAKLGSGSYIAPNAVVRDRTEVGDFAVLAAGSVAYKPLPEGSTWIGNPARRAV
ncbi:hypothetical protein GCM10007421_03650 [Halopseudomonas oceani]|uniref:Acetyltransferase n=1 Tax=Halopseudomonas oceani TaxID=1708783 RepID=A0A2P4EXZ1_9GAMM|nr:MULTISPECIES: hypothetical protein [Halopseudomonas]MCC4260207.1 hypothetical protein [Halopseudomonas aestusnigri]POB05100.1 hypothetical protein C1949_04840 [Halopseudomonas oceani]GGE33135.1 hypothetical protein GCM10007421_03650 [Halopseudomonas oceani]